MVDIRHGIAPRLLMVEKVKRVMYKGKEVKLRDLPKDVRKEYTKYIRKLDRNRNPYEGMHSSKRVG